MYYNEKKYLLSNKKKNIEKNQKNLIGKNLNNKNKRDILIECTS